MYEIVPTSIKRCVHILFNDNNSCISLIRFVKFIENIHDANNEKYLKKIFLSGIETTLKATNDKELENRIKNFSNF